MPAFARLGILDAYRERAAAHLVAPFGMSLIDAQTLSLLRLLGAGASPCPSDLVRSPFYSRAGMTRTLDRLEARGFVERHMDRADRRRVLVSLTEEGEGAADRFREAELEFMDRML